MYAPVDEIINFKQQLYQPSKLLKKQYKNFFFRTPNITIPLPQIPNPISSYGLVQKFLMSEIELVPFVTFLSIKPVLLRLFRQLPHQNKLCDTSLFNFVLELQQFLGRKVCFGSYLSSTTLIFLTSILIIGFMNHPKRSKRVIFNISLNIFSLPYESAYSIPESANHKPLPSSPSRSITQLYLTLKRMRCSKIQNHKNILISSEIQHKKQIDNKTTKTEAHDHSCSQDKLLSAIF